MVPGVIKVERVRHLGGGTGDDWEADILGARDFGMDQAYLTLNEQAQNALNAANGNGAVRHNYKPTYTLHSLHELIGIV